MPSAPPKVNRRPAATTAAKKETRETSAEQLRKDREEGVNGLFQIGQLACIMTGNWADAGAFETHGPNVSRETAELGARYEKVGKSLDVLSQVGPFTAIIGAVVPLILQIAANHGKVPADKVAGFGVVTPAILEAQQKMQMQQMEMQAKAMQRQQQEAFQREQDAFNEMMAAETVNA